MTNTIDTELSILRNAVDKIDKIKGKIKMNSKTIFSIIEIIEQFIINKNLICYGGTAINNILPKHAQFYNKEYEVPDYDFYSSNALDDAKELADIYFKEGYDARQNEYVDLVKEGIIDPTLVVTSALRHATSAALNLLSISCSVTVASE